MRIVLQRVKQACVTVEEKIVGDISNGLLLFVGITHDDTTADADKLVEKILKLRLFADEGSKSFMEKNVVEANGNILVVSQFTLYGDCSKGTRPSFTDAARPEQAKEVYDYFVKAIREKSLLPVQTGEFGAHMAVELVNDGPVTLILESK